MSERFGMLAGADGNVMIGNSSTDFDAYYDGLLGHGPKKARPGKFLEEPVKAFVNRMAAERPPGWREAAGACLEMSIPELAFACAKAEEAARTADREGVLVALEAGRVALVGIPTNVGVATALREFDPGSAPTLVIFTRQPKARGRVEIVWANYAKPVTFDLSDFERAAFAASAASAFEREAGT